MAKSVSLRVPADLVDEPSQIFALILAFAVNQIALQLVSPFDFATVVSNGGMSAMMFYVENSACDISSMPRGGPDASWLDRRLQTNRLEYLDRDDVDDLKRKVMDSLDRAGRRRRIGIHERCARLALREVADVRTPKILELGAGLGGLSRKLLEMHPTAEVTVTDIDPTFVARAAAGDLGSHPRASVQVMDATAIDAPDGHYDLAIFALSLHHLSPELAAHVFAAGTRAAQKLLIVDLPRPPAPVHLALLAVVLPLTGLSPLQHDGFISSLRAYSPSALRALARHADPAITVEFRTRRGLGPTVAVARHGGNRLDVSACAGDT